METTDDQPVDAAKETEELRRKAGALDALMEAVASIGDHGGQDTALVEVILDKIMERDRIRRQLEGVIASQDKLIEDMDGIIEVKEAKIVQMQKAFGDACKMLETRK